MAALAPERVEALVLLASGASEYVNWHVRGSARYDHGRGYVLPTWRVLQRFADPLPAAYLVVHGSHDVRT